MTQLIHYLPFITFAVAATWLSVFDLKTHRLPNLGVAFCLGMVLVAMTLDSFFNLSSWAQIYAAWFVAGKASLKIFLSFLAIYVISQGQFGLGDVKFAVPLGLVVGWYIPSFWVAVIMVSFALAAVVSSLLVLAKRISLRDRIAFGPYMSLSAILLVLVGS